MPLLDWHVLHLGGQSILEPLFMAGCLPSRLPACTTCVRFTIGRPTPLVSPCHHPISRVGFLSSRQCCRCPMTVDSTDSEFTSSSRGWLPGIIQWRLWSNNQTQAPEQPDQLHSGGGRQPMFVLGPPKGGLDAAGLQHTPGRQHACCQLQVLALTCPNVFRASLARHLASVAVVTG